MAVDLRARERLYELAEVGLCRSPTPLHRLGRLSESAGAEIWIKRDDAQGPTIGGNKLRKFDLVVAEALARGCDTLVTTGALQSNSARVGAAVAAMAGMRCTLVIGGAEPARPTGNLLLSRMVGADLRYVEGAGWAEMDQAVKTVQTELSRDGRTPYGVPVGCSTPLGNLGFARAFIELAEQCEANGIQPAAIVHASSSGGTHAGLLVGRSLAGWSTRLVAVDTAALVDSAESLLVMARASAELIGHDLDLAVQDIEIDGTQLGPGYAKNTPAANAAISSLARQEAVLADPIYSGKGLAGLLAMLDEGLVQTAPDRPVIFWHTGGYQALFDPRFGDQQVSPPG